MEVYKTSKTDQPTPFILDVCVNIKNLRMFAWRGVTHLQYHGRHLAWGTRNLKLESLDFDNLGMGVIHLLKNQPTLRSLRMQDKYNWSFDDLLPTDVPCLRSVAGSVWAVDKLVPNRPVEDVEVGMSPFYFTDTDPQDRKFLDTCASFFKQLERSTKPIKRLVFRLQLTQRGKSLDVADTFHKVIDLGESIRILRGLEEFEIQTMSLQMPLVHSSFGLSIQT